MFDISWTEFLLIGVVALVVIGPKELPAVMRMLGQWTRKVRSMASEFQGQFHEAMREAEMSDLKKQVDDIASGVAADVTSLDPLKTVRDDVEAVGKDLEGSLHHATEPAAPPAGEPPVSPDAATPEAASAPAVEASSLPPPEVEGIGAAAEKVEPAAAPAEKVAQPAASGHAE